MALVLVVAAHSSGMCLRVCLSAHNSCGFCTWACPFNAPQLSAAAGKMQKCNFCQTPGRERPLHMPRACEEICPTGAIRSGPMSELAKVGREAAASRLGTAGMQGLPGLMVQAQQSFGPGAGD